MNTLRRMSATPLVALAIVLGTTGTATAAADNVAVAVNTRDSTYVWRQAFKIERVYGDVVDESNGAWAQSSCEDCRTTAVAVQVVIATGDATNVTSVNLAGAVNQNCERCATYAGAFQFVLTPHEPMHFTDAGNAEIDAIRADLQSLIEGATFGHTLEEVDAFDTQVRALADRLENVLHTELVRAGGGNLIEKVRVDEAA